MGKHEVYFNMLGGNMHSRLGQKQMGGGGAIFLMKNALIRLPP